MNLITDADDIYDLLMKIPGTDQEKINAVLATHRLEPGPDDPDGSKTYLSKVDLAEGCYLQQQVVLHESALKDLEQSLEIIKCQGRFQFRFQLVKIIGLRSISRN
jgi:hypothetical protein